jgi:hypothetical protein
LLQADSELDTGISLGDAGKLYSLIVPDSQKRPAPASVLKHG